MNEKVKNLIFVVEIKITFVDCCINPYQKVFVFNNKTIIILHSAQNEKKNRVHYFRSKYLVDIIYRLIFYWRLTLTFDSLFSLDLMWTFIEEAKKITKSPSFYLIQSKISFCLFYSHLIFYRWNVYLCPSAVVKHEFEFNVCVRYFFPYKYLNDPC